MAHEFRATGKHDNSKAGNAVKADALQQPHSDA